MWHAPQKAAVRSSGDESRLAWARGATRVSQRATGPSGAGESTIDGLPYSRGSTAKLKAGRHNIRVGTEEKYISISRACTVRESPQLDCF